MKRWLRVGVLGVVGLVGVASMVATSPPPPVLRLFVLTQNDHPSFPPQDYWYGGGVVHACLGEQVSVLWRLWEGASSVPRLSVTPEDAVDPRVSGRTLTGDGDLAVTVLSEATVEAQDGSGYPVRYELRLLPDDLCAGFPQPVIGWYQGVLAQTEPQPQALPRDLRVYWSAADALEATLSQDATRWDAAAQNFICTAQPAADTLTCTHFVGEEAVIVLSGVLDATGYRGSYEGFAETATVRIPVAGTFEFVKQSEWPPLPDGF